LSGGVNNVGPMAMSAVKALEALGVRATEAVARFPIQATADDFTLADWVVAHFALQTTGSFTVFHLEGVEVGRRVSVKIDPSTGERLGLLATGIVGDGGWVDLQEQIMKRAGEAFVAMPESTT
jgi:hypothetical protein